MGASRRIRTRRTRAKMEKMEKKMEKWLENQKKIKIKRSNRII